MPPSSPPLAKTARIAFVQDCVAESPGAGRDEITSIFSFEGHTNGHRLCAIRNCAVRGANGFENPVPAITGAELRAISPGLGLGTIIEGNQIANCHAGVFYGPATSDKPAKDIVVWNNTFRNVTTGIRFDNSITPGLPVGRVVLMDNLIEFATSSGSPSGPVGILLTGSTGTRYSQVVIRKNVMNAVIAFESGFTPKGIDVDRCGELIAENNIISDTLVSNGVRFSNCASRKFFNNQTKAGQLLRGYDGTKFVLELEDAVQDVLLPL